MLRTTLLELRKLKRRLKCIDRRISFAKRPMIIGYTNEGSPLFDWSGPIRVRVPTRLAEHSNVALTVWSSPEYQGPWSAAIRVCSNDCNHTIPLPCRPKWETIPIIGAAHGEARNAHDHADAVYQIEAAGPGSESLAFGELKVEPDLHLELRQQVQGVSFPRSGHHMLVDFLKGYFGSAFRYCGLAPYCGRIPCADPAKNLQKNHDHDLQLPCDDQRDYLIQYRQPLESIASYYELQLKNGRIPAAAEGVTTWREHAVRAIDEWRRWVTKWVIGNNHPRALKVGYEDVMRDPGEQLRRVVQFFAPKHEVDERRLARVVRHCRIKPRRRLGEFRYYEPAFLAQLEFGVRDEIEALRLPLLMSGGRSGRRSDGRSRRAA